MKFRTLFNVDRDEISRLNAFTCSSEEVTVQSEKDECDINTLVKRFGLTGVMPVDQRPLMQGDFSEVFDFRSAMDSVVAARESFMQMPSAVRERFDNDPQKFLQFCEDKDNLSEARKLGIALPAVESSDGGTVQNSGEAG